jgi:hypothetical protein
MNKHCRTGRIFTARSLHFEFEPTILFNSLHFMNFHWYTKNQFSYGNGWAYPYYILIKIEIVKIEIKKITQETLITVLIVGKYLGFARRISMENSCLNIYKNQFVG